MPHPLSDYDVMYVTLRLDRCRVCFGLFLTLYRKDGHSLYDRVFYVLLKLLITPKSTYA